MIVYRLGYSGSREGMSVPQLQAVYGHISEIRLVHDSEDMEYEAHHGDCLGGDLEFHVLAAATRWRTVAHPPVNPAKRAWCRVDIMLPPKGYLARDWDIARDTGELIATPKTPRPVPGSGTWTTVGYAVQLGRPVTVFLPDGTGVDGASFFGAPLPARPS